MFVFLSKINAFILFIGCNFVFLLSLYLFVTWFLLVIMWYTQLFEVMLKNLVEQSTWRKNVKLWVATKNWLVATTKTFVWKQCETWVELLILQAFLRNILVCCCSCLFRIWAKYVKRHFCEQLWNHLFYNFHLLYFVFHFSQFFNGKMWSGVSFIVCCIQPNWSWSHSWNIFDYVLK